MYVCMYANTRQLDAYERCMERSSDKSHCKLHEIIKVGLYDKYIDEWSVSRSVSIHIYALLYRTSVFPMHFFWSV